MDKHVTAFADSQFQSTHPVRGATIFVHLFTPNERNFNPRTPCGVRPPTRASSTRPPNFNPRTPCGVRRLPSSDANDRGEFQSTHPVRGATIVAIDKVAEMTISIHAPRAGCDDLGCVVKIFVVGISIHAPRAGCDDRRTHVSAATLISIHAPRAGCDRGAPYQRCRRARFQSTHPVRGATSADSRPVTSAAIFQSTHPVRGATPLCAGACRRRRISIHAPRAGCDKCPV